MVGMLLLAEYALGVGSWFIPLGVLISGVCHLLQGRPRFVQWLQRLASATLIGTGLLIFQGRLRYFFRWVPAPTPDASLSDPISQRGPHVR